MKTLLIAGLAGLALIPASAMAAPLRAMTPFCWIRRDSRFKAKVPEREGLFDFWGRERTPEAGCRRGWGRSGSDVRSH